MNDKSTIEKIRQFTRFYTHFFGLYNNNYLESKFSLTEARVIFELGRKKENSAKELSENLLLDSGYLSRIISKFENNGYLQREKCKCDGRRQFLSLTAKGRRLRARLDEMTNQQISGIVSGLSDEKKKKFFAEKWKRLKIS